MIIMKILIKMLVTVRSLLSIVSYKRFNSKGTKCEISCVPGYNRRAFMLSNCNKISDRKPNILFDVTGPVPGAARNYSIYSFIIIIW